jgi:hypothetical protein
VPHLRIHGLDRRRQASTAVGNDQSQGFALQPAPVQILEQGFPVRLALALAAQKRQQVTGAVAAHPIGHQHLHPLAPRRTPHPQTHPIQKQVGIVIGEPGGMELAHRLVQIPRQLGNRLRAHRFSGQRGHHPPHLPGADARRYARRPSLP